MVWVTMKIILIFSCSRPGEDLRYSLNDKKLKSLGWEPKMDFDVVLVEIIEYYKNKFIW